MSIPQEYYVIREMQYQEMLTEQKLIAETAKQILLSIEPKGLYNKTAESGEQIKPEYLLVRIVNEYFKEAVFFHDAKTLEKLQQLKLKPQVLRWFISLKDIHDQYESIRNNHIKIDVILAFTFIKTYLSSKLLKELLLNALPHTRDGVEITQLTNELINLKSRRKYSGPNPAKSKKLFQHLLNNAVNEFIAIPVDEFGMKKFEIKTFIQFSRANTESIFLKLLLEECFEYDSKTMSETKFLSIVYDLFRVILQDHALITESDFFYGKNRSYQSYKSFKSYQAKKLRSIIYPKRKTE